MGSKAGQQQETAQQRASADHAVAQLADYRQRWLPVQQRLASTIEKMGAKNSTAREIAAGKASTDTAMAFDRGATGLEKGLTNAGVAPGSSRSNLAITGMGADKATATGLGAMMSEQQIDDAYTAGLGALTAIGRGEKATVGQSMQRMAANSSAQAASDAAISLQARQGEAALAGQVVGFGVQQGAGALGGMSFGGGPQVNSSTPMNYGAPGTNYGTPQAGV